MTTKNTKSIEQTEKSAEQVKNEAAQKLAADLAVISTTSGKIRFLHGMGFKRGQIAKMLGKRYQHVRNVLITPVATPRTSAPATSAE